jgi:sortase (surface protein transpeptidase)
MRKGWGPRALRALAGALLLAIVSTASALATPSPALVRSAAGALRPADVALGAALDRAAVAPSREHAHVAAIAAAYARAHPIHKHTKPAAKAKPHRASKPAPKQAPVVRNHLWIPALGISRSVAPYSCSRTTPPGPYVYRWGCAGRNNVYLLGHASGVFKALHDAYLSGKLKVGMVAIYADGRGHLHHYRVTGWKVVSPSDVSWASATRTQTMTLQTCMGANNAYRLDVRLAAYY